MKVNEALKVILPVIRQMEHEDIRQVMNTVRSEYDHVLAQTARVAFKPGTRVWWNSRRGYKVNGVVRDMGPKNVMVTADDGTRWKVHPSFLHTDDKEVDLSTFK